MSPPGEHLLVPIEALVCARGESWEDRAGWREVRPRGVRCERQVSVASCAEREARSGSLD
jgi:hypothetical protein